MRFHKSTHAVYRLEYHVVWTPRYRRKILEGPVREYLQKTLEHLDKLDDDIVVKKVNVQIDHIHMIIVIPPRVSVSSVVGFFKSQTAKLLKKGFSYLRFGIKGRGSIWSRGYCVTSVGVDEKFILHYVEHQEKIDKGLVQLSLGL